MGPSTMYNIFIYINYAHLNVNCSNYIGCANIHFHMNIKQFQVDKNAILENKDEGEALLYLSTYQPPDISASISSPIHFTGQLPSPILPYFPLAADSSESLKYLSRSTRPNLNS